jgi:peptidoglycan/LPS O-acetylase OafA/YrhL
MPQAATSQAVDPHITTTSSIPNSTINAVGHASAAYRADIDGLRAIAVLGVVLFHAFPAAVPGGFVGVDVFFVISGYLIGSILFRQLHEQRFSFTSFYARRIKRIFPSLFLVLCFCYVFGWFNLIDTEYKQLGKHIAAGSAFVSNLALWQEAGYFDTSAEAKPLLHLWSLGVEEQFYLLWPIVLFALNRCGFSIRNAILWIGVASFALNLIISRADATADFYSPVTRFWELMVGCWLAQFHVKGNSVQLRMRPAMGWIGGFLIFVSFLGLRGQSGYPGWAALLPTIGAAMLIAADPHSFVNRRVLQAKLLVWIGLISFPLYLWHWPLLVFARLEVGGTPAWSVRALAVAVSVLLAWICYRFVERPIRFGRQRVWVVPVLLGVMLAIGVQGFNTYRRNGLDFRLSHMVSQFAAVQANVSDGWRVHTCFLETRDNVDMFVRSCTDSGNQPLVFLWGDSKAAALYPGLRSLQDHSTFRIAEYAAADCAPFLGSNAANARCGAIHQSILAKIKSERPALVVVTGNWVYSDVAKIGSTVDALRAAGVRRIVVVGPTPTWRDPLPKVYWLYWRQHHQVLPARTSFGLSGGLKELDSQLHKEALRLGISYVSAYDALCDKTGCETRTGAGQGQILMIDHTHLTSSGSVALMQAIGPQVLQGVGQQKQ